MGSCSDPDRKTIEHRGLVIHITVNLRRRRSVLCCAVLHLQHLLQACAGLHVSLGAGQTQPGDGNGGARRQLPLCTSDYTPAWPCLYLTVQQQVLR